MNRLANERSPYLRHAAHQQIDWYPWSDEPFERAKREDKPVFLSSGGVWCHWCHVMARESFDDPEVLSLLNEHFISVKLDRDERPDIDRRYQQANALMGNAGGWPLSIFLTPDRRPFFGGTYFPPDDRHGRPGFRKVLRSVSEFYRSRRDDADQYGVRVMDAVKTDAFTPGELRPDLADLLQAAMLERLDRTNGGFGSAPKFPMPGAIEFLIRRAAAGHSAAAAAVKLTLGAMARGGFHDQLGGGFHRYSVDEGWFVPHFEKMADDNAWLLRNYLDAFALFGEERYRRVSEGIIRCVRDALSDPAGGFYASQDADVTPDDEGGYFTWTDRELHDLLTIEEYEVLRLHFFHEQGRMHHDPEKRVLSLARTTREVAEALGRTDDDVAAIIVRSREKLLDARRRRQAPFIDRTLYTSLNGMFITSFLKAFRVLGDAGCREFALRSLDRIMRERYALGEVQHAEGIPGLLDDHVYLIEALIAAYEATAERRHLDSAVIVTDGCLARFGDPAGGFFDTAGEVLGARLKRVEDVPHPSANAVAIVQLVKLWHISGKETYRDAAEGALRAFALAAGEMSIHAGTYACGLDAWFHLLKLTVGGPVDSALVAAALRLGGPQTVVVHGGEDGRIIPCVNETCREPVTRAEDLARFAGCRTAP